MTNLLTTISEEMDEIFRLPTKHDMLQHIIDVFAWHSLPCQPNNHKIQKGAS